MCTAPGALPPGRPWELPLAPPSLPPAWDSADIPASPSMAPWFTGPASADPVIGNRPAWMDSVTPADEGRGLLSQLSRVARRSDAARLRQPVPEHARLAAANSVRRAVGVSDSAVSNHLEPNSLSLWQ